MKFLRHVHVVSGVGTELTRFRFGGHAFSSQKLGTLKTSMLPSWLLRIGVGIRVQGSVDLRATLNPNPETQNPETLNPKFHTLNSKPPTAKT